MEGPVTCATESPQFCRWKNASNAVARVNVQELGKISSFCRLSQRDEHSLFQFTVAERLNTQLLVVQAPAIHASQPVTESQQFSHLWPIHKSQKVSIGRNTKLEITTSIYFQMLDFFALFMKYYAALTHSVEWRGERRAYQSHIDLVICSIIRLAIRGARSQSSFSNTSQRGRMAIRIMCTNMWMFVRMWKQFIHTETEAYECSCKWRGEARARMCKCSITVYIPMISQSL